MRPTGLYPECDSLSLKTRVPVDPISERAPRTDFGRAHPGPSTTDLGPGGDGPPRDAPFLASVER